MTDVVLVPKVFDAIDELADLGFEARLTSESYANIAEAGFNRVGLPLAIGLAQLAIDYQPITVRGLGLYRAQGAGLIPDTSAKWYRQTARVILLLRRAGIVPYSWIVDSTRRRLKPSSWAGLKDFAADAAEAYRKDLWQRQEDYIEFIVEKDAMAGIIEPVTDEFDVYLNVIRGQVSETFVWNVAEALNGIEKPIHLYYVGDHDPAGFEIESAMKRKLQGFMQRDFTWQRLAITGTDFANPDLIGFPVKRKTRKRSNGRKYIKRYGDRCVEVDALPPDEIRDRVRDAIEHHIVTREWRQLQKIEELERETWRKSMADFSFNGASATPRRTRKQRVSPL